MNLFRSEEHARNWSEFDPENDNLLQPLEHYSELFSREMFRARAGTKFMSWLKERAQKASGP